MGNFGRRSEDNKAENLDLNLLNEDVDQNKLIPTNITHNIETIPKKEISKEEIDHPIFKTRDFVEQNDISEFKERLFELVVKQIDLSAASKMQRSDLRREIEGYLVEYSKDMNLRVSHKELHNIIDDIINDMIGLGPLEILLKNNNINDIMINAYNKIFVEIKGKVYKTDVSFRSEKHSLQIAQRIANQIGRRIDESSPLVDARLKDGSRVNIVIPPVSIDGTSVSIRKFSSHIIHLQDMPATGNVSKQMVAFLIMVARSRLNILISGGTGAGKTTLLNAISQLIDRQERIVSIEDAAELKLQQPHVVRLESRPANIEGQGLITIRDLVKNALRMRPDRIIIGECRGAEAFDMLQAMNTGHDGSMSTLHSNSSSEALSRLENMVLMSGNQLPNEVIKSYIGDAVDIIVQIARMRDGTRRVIQITEISGYENGIIGANDVFLFHHTGSDATHVEGDFVFKGLSEGLVEKILDKGFKHELDKFLHSVKE